MTTKKVVVIALGVVATLFVVVVLFIGAIFAAVFYSINNSEAAATAKGFLRDNEKLRAEIGPVRDFGWFITGTINASDADSDATLNLTVIGEKKKVDARVALLSQHGREWRVSGASYVDGGTGQVIKLLDTYEAESGASPSAVEDE